MNSVRFSINLILALIHYAFYAAIMPMPICPVEFALWWFQNFQRVKACVWSPAVEQIELFEAICHLRADSWRNRFAEIKAGKWKLLGIRSSADRIDRQDFIREVLVSELLVRLLAASAKAIRAGEIRERVHPILHEAFLDNRQSRCLALELLIEELDRGAVWARSLNRLRITIEQWTDLLLGILSAKQNIPVANYQVYGFRIERIREFAFEASERDQATSGMLEDWFLLQGVRRTMRSFGPCRSSHPDWDSQVRHLAAGFLEPESFRSANLANSLQIDQRFDSLEHWFSMLGEAN